MISPRSLSLGRMPCLAAVLLLLLSRPAAPAQQRAESTRGQKPDAEKQEPRAAPVEQADEKKSKLTFSLYVLNDDRNYDINIRHQFGKVVAWAAVFYDPKGDSQARVGAEYDFQYKWLLLIPTFEAGTNGALAGSVYSEIGEKTYAIAGYSQTNLKPFNDLFFDPSESVQIGVGRKINSYDRVYGFSIFDVRLHTHQQDTHILWRHRIDDNNGVTFDWLYKSGRGDDGRNIRAIGIGMYYDRPTWFWKAYYDPFVNFSRQTMVRFGLGLKF